MGIKVICGNEAYGWIFIGNGRSDVLFPGEQGTVAYNAKWLGHTNDLLPSSDAFLENNDFSIFQKQEARGFFSFSKNDLVFLIESKDNVIAQVYFLFRG